MANSEHLAILERGVEAWNKWREENSEEEPDLRKAHLRHANLQGAFLSFANLQGADLRHANLQGADLLNTNLRANLWSANLQGAGLVGADLQGAILVGADLQGADLLSANLQGALLIRVDLQDADLAFAKLTGLDLRDANNLEGIHLWNATLDGARLPRERLGGRLGEEISEEWEEAQEAYLSLKNLWAQQGRYDDAAWAYRKERRMEKKAALKRAVEARQKKDWRGAIKSYVRVASDWTQELICDYGESVWRVLASIAILWVGFAILYGVFALVWGPWQEVALGTGNIERTRATTQNVVQLLAYSLGTMTGAETVGLEAFPCLAMQILPPVQSFLGIGLAGLLGFVLGNRIRRS